MKMGVFDYIIKPIDPELFKKTILKAVEYKHLREMEESLSISASLKIRNQLEWLNYKEDRRITGKDYAEIKSIYNLKTSLTQGTGFGSLLTMIDIIKNSKKENGDNYLIDKQMLDVLIQNFDTCNAQLKGLHSISNMLENKFSFDVTNAATLVEAIPEMLSKILPHLKIKILIFTFRN